MAEQLAGWFWILYKAFWALVAIWICTLVVTSLFDRIRRRRPPSERKYDDATY